MKSFFLKETDSTPLIHLDSETGCFEISGSSLPENVLVVYDPVFEWLKEYKITPQPLTVLNLKLRYFNSATAKILLYLICFFENLAMSGHKVVINWGYFESDEESLEAGQDYESMVTIPFNFIKID
jgi:hypothetical protein